MSGTSQATRPTARGARILVRVSGLVVLCGLGFLVADHGVAWGRSDSEKATIETLEAQVKREPAAAQALHEERERQTDASLARRERSGRVAWLILVAGGVFVATGKRITSLAPAPAPGLDELVELRFAVPPQPNRRNGSAPSGGTVPVDSEIDASFVDALVQRLGRGRESAIPILQGIQAHYRFLPDEALRRVCELTEITPAQIAGTSSFYSQFRRSPVGRHVVRVCHGTACHVAGAEQITQELRRHLQIPEGRDTDAKRLFTVDAVACVGCCSLAPVMMIEEEAAGRLTPASARQRLESLVCEG
jgi:NADH:ubiquinone oxidoreductase subunit E